MGDMTWMFKLGGGMGAGEWARGKRSWGEQVRGLKEVWTGIWVWKYGAQTVSDGLSRATSVTVSWIFVSFLTTKLVVDIMCLNTYLYGSRAPFEHFKPT